MHFHHLRIFVVQICRRHLRTFSANFVWPETETPPIFSPLECMHQRRQTALENKETRQNNRPREEQRLQHSLLVSIKSTAALYFYNQKLMNQFFQNTLQHPYFQQFKLPLSFNQTLRKLGLGSDHVDKVNLDHKDADPNHDPDPVNHDLDVVGDDDKMKCESFVYHWSQIQEKQCKSGLSYISR